MIYSCFSLINFCTQWTYLFALFIVQDGSWVFWLPDLKEQPGLRERCDLSCSPWLFVVLCDRSSHLVVCFMVSFQVRWIYECDVYISRSFHFTEQTGSFTGTLTILQNSVNLSLCSTVLLANLLISFKHRSSLSFDVWEIVTLRPKSN